MSAKDQHLLAIEINALRVAEIATLKREAAFWRNRCRLLDALVSLPFRPLVPADLNPASYCLHEPTAG